MGNFLDITCLGKRIKYFNIQAVNDSQVNF